MWLGATIAVSSPAVFLDFTGRLYFWTKAWKPDVNVVKTLEKSELKSATPLLGICLEIHLHNTTTSYPSQVSHFGHDFLTISSKLPLFQNACKTHYRKTPLNTLLLLLFASTKFCDFGIPTILRVLFLRFHEVGLTFAI